MNKKNKQIIKFWINCEKNFYQNKKSDGIFANHGIEMGQNNPSQCHQNIETTTGNSTANPKSIQIIHVLVK